MVDYEAFEKLTKQLVDFDNIRTYEDDSTITLKMDKGECKGWPIFELEGVISVLKFFSPKGSEFFTHIHDQKEWIIMYDGEMIVTYDENKMKKLTNGDGVYIEKNTAHTTSVLKDSWFLVVTIPSLNKE